jgi:cobalamin biosynthesis Mg chelatase CobN
MDVKMRFNKRIKIAPGIKLNISKSGVSTTLGGRGASVNVGKKGAYLNTSLPGTGLSDRTKISGKTTPKTQNEQHEANPKSGAGSTFLMVVGIVAVVVLVVILVL